MFGDEQNIFIVYVVIWLYESRTWEQRMFSGWSKKYNVGFVLVTNEFNPIYSWHFKGSLPPIDQKICHAFLAVILYFQSLGSLWNEHYYSRYRLHIMAGTLLICMLPSMCLIFHSISGIRNAIFIPITCMIGFLRSLQVSVYLDKLVMVWW